MLDSIIYRLSINFDLNDIQHITELNIQQNIYNISQNSKNLGILQVNYSLEHSYNKNIIMASKVVHNLMTLTNFNDMLFEKLRIVVFHDFRNPRKSGSDIFEGKCEGGGL